MALDGDGLVAQGDGLGDRPLLHALEDADAAALDFALADSELLFDHRHDYFAAHIFAPLGDEGRGGHGCCRNRGGVQVGTALGERIMDVESAVAVHNLPRFLGPVIVGVGDFQCVPSPHSFFKQLGVAFGNAFFFEFMAHRRQRVLGVFGVRLFEINMRPVIVAADQIIQRGFCVRAMLK